MTEEQSKAAKRRYDRESEVICPTCDGKGRILSESVKTRARQGGNAGYLASLKPGARAMGERNQGAKRELTLAEMRARDAEQEKEEKREPASRRPTTTGLKRAPGE